MAVAHMDVLRQMKSRRPFMPVRIVTTAGGEYTMHDPFQFAITPTRVLLYADAEPDRPVDLRPDQIAAVEQMQKKPAA